MGQAKPHNIYTWIKPLQSLMLDKAFTFSISGSSPNNLHTLLQPLQSLYLDKVQTISKLGSSLYNPYTWIKPLQSLYLDRWLRSATVLTAEMSGVTWRTGYISKTITAITTLDQNGQLQNGLQMQTMLQV